MSSVFVGPWIFGLISYYFLFDEDWRYAQIFIDIILILDFKVSPCFTSHFISSLWRWNRYSVLKRRHSIIRRRGNTQKITHNILIVFYLLCSCIHVDSNDHWRHSGEYITKYSRFYFWLVTFMGFLNSD